MSHPLRLRRICLHLEHVEAELAALDADPGIAPEARSAIRQSRAYAREAGVFAALGYCRLAPVVDHAPQMVGS